MKIVPKVIMVSALGLALAVTANAQTNLQFTGVSATDEGAIRLSWASQSNHIYQVQCADTLVDTNTGTPPWQTLYDNYPSHGTNTFIGDFGNYRPAPPILHPKTVPLRFYRILDQGPDTTSDEPSVSIISPTNGALVSDELTITVAAATDQRVLAGTKLYVDGQEMRSAVATTNYADGGTNYQTDTYNINTCEWGNGTHTLFATVECESDYGDAPNSPPIFTGRAVSPYVPATFSNLVTRISFSEPSFDPASGQTQQVSAVFAGNSDWTLTIRDVYSNAVRTVTGSGNSMQFDWDGKGDGGTNITTGIYYYYISAQTNGQPSQVTGGGSGGGSGGSPPSPASADSDVQELWAMPTNSSGGAVPLAIYPPGFDTSGLFIFSASQSEIQAQRVLVSSAQTSTADSGPATESFSSQASQNAAAAPGRPPSNPIVGIIGLFGIAYDTYTGNGTNGYDVGPLDNGFGIGIYIPMEGYPASATIHFAPLPQFTAEANNFIDEMQLYGWKKPNGLAKADSQLNIGDLQGSGTPFNQVDLAVLLSHGTYGSGPDYTASGCLQMYYPITSGGSAQYLRLSEMNLGGAGTNGLKWFAILACNSLQDFNWDDMQNNGVYPYNGNLHLLLGTDSVVSAHPHLLENWGRYMSYSRGAYWNPMTIREAWYAAAIDAYQRGSYTNTMVYAVAGDSACFDDYVFPGYNTPPQGIWRYESRQVWPTPP